MTATGAVSPASERLLPELASRFRETLDRLSPGDGRIGLAVSGGTDSLAMLLLAHEAVAGRFEVATVDHGLRPEASAECAWVARICADRGIACAILRVAVGAGNMQAEARRARYAALAQWAGERGLAAVATAHHADDQAETLLMRLNRGSGVAGLAGVREVSMLGALKIIRPLLDWRRNDLAAVCALAGLDPVQDPSNSNADFDRVRIRQALGTADWIDSQALARSARNLADAYAALQDYAALLWQEQVRPCDEAGYIITPVPSREMNRRLLAMAMDRLGGRPRGGDVARLLDRLEQGRGGNVGRVLAQAKNGCWHLRPEPPRRTG